MGSSLKSREDQLSHAMVSRLRLSREEAKTATALLERGFQLAFFLLPERATAINILTGALEKLKVQSRREIKRLYWRDKHPEHPVRRMARNYEDMLQWLIMFESERYERAQEEIGNASLRSMVTRYIKYLIQVTTALSSFYANVAVMRLLHSYSTAETQRAYETLTNRYPGADEYRRAKAVLMDKVSRRFEGLLRTTRVEHGELRFEVGGDQGLWKELTEECLTTFTPWSTQGLCSRLANRETATAPDADRNELEWSHSFIDPACFRRLVRHLSLDAPEARLALPRFVMSEKRENNSDSNKKSDLMRPPSLAPEDLDEIERRLASRDARRQKINPRFVTLLVDGVERKQFDLIETKQVQLDLEPGASLIEIWGRDELGELLLATHVVPYAESAVDSSRGAVAVGKGTLRFDIAAGATDASSRARLTVDYNPKLQWGWLTQTYRRRKTIAGYAIAGLTLALAGWGIASAFYAHRIKVLEQRLKQAHGEERQLPPTTARAILSYKLTPDDQWVRGPGMTGIPEISLLRDSPAIGLELPLSGTQESGVISAELKTFSGDLSLLTINFLKATRTNAGSSVEIVVPNDLLKADTYYTVHLHTPERTDRFTFKVVAK